jgi:hypothetical protein
VLIGEIVNETFVVRRADRGSDSELYLVITGETHDEVTPTGQRIVSTRVDGRPVRAGETYALDAGTFHCTRDSGGAIITVVAGRDMSPELNLFIGPAGQQKRRTRREICSVEESAVLAQDVQRMLAIY